MFTVNIAKLNTDGTLDKAKRLALPKTRETLDAFLMNLGVNSQNHYAYSILSIDASQPAFAPSISNIKDIDLLNYIALYENNFHQETMAKILELVKALEPKNSEELIEIMNNWLSYSTCTGIKGYEQLGRYAADTQYKVTGNMLGKHIDFEGLGKEFHSMVKGKFVEEGYLFNTNRLDEHYCDYLPYLYDGSPKGITICIATMEEIKKSNMPQGVWLNLPVSEYTLGRARHRLGVTSFEECLICDSVPNNLMDVDFYEIDDSIMELNTIAEKLEKLEERDVKKICAIIECEKKPELSTLINILHNLDCYDFYEGVTLGSDDDDSDQYTMKRDGGQMTSYGYIKRNSIPMCEVYTPQEKITQTMGGCKC